MSAYIKGEAQDWGFVMEGGATTATNKLADIMGKEWVSRSLLAENHDGS
jgi:hypothetical protein